ECAPVLRSSNRAFDQGWNGTSPGFRSAARSCTYLLLLGSHTPDRSGLPSGNRGAGAERFGFPSGVRGMLARGTFTHWAWTGAHARARAAMEEAIIFFIFSLPKVAAD